MRKIWGLSLVLLALVTASCGSGSSSSALVPLDFTGDVMLSNGDFDLTIYQIEEIESKDFVNGKFSLKDSFKETHTLYEIRMRYTNLTDEEKILSYRQLWVSIPDVEDPGEQLAVVGYCEPEEDSPTGNPTWCAYLPPPPEPGKYGVTGVFHMGAPWIQPGEDGWINLVVIVEKTLTELEISFIEPE